MGIRATLCGRGGSCRSGVEGGGREKGEGRTNPGEVNIRLFVSPIMTAPGSIAVGQG